MEPVALPSACDLGGGRFELTVPDTLPCWPGHFPGWLVVPGALELHWVLALAVRWLAQPLELRRVERVKFAAPIGPGERIVIALERGLEDRIAFRISGGERSYASGLIRVAAPGAGEKTA